MMLRMKMCKFIKELPTSLFGEMSSNTRLDNLDSLKTLITSGDATNLDLLYLTHSGDKYISKLCIYSYDEDVITPADRSKYIADLLLMKFGSNWNRMYETLLEEYNPTNDYDKTTHEEFNSKVKNTSASKRYGFNTPADTPVGDTDIESESSGLKDDNFTDSHIYGNIGINSRQKLINDELELRKKNIIEMIFNDIDTMLCLKIY